MTLRHPAIGERSWWARWRWSPGLLAVLVVATLPALPASSLESRHSIAGEFWILLDRLAAPDIAPPLDVERFTELLLDETERHMSSMIYGFDFEYIPAAPRRQVAESLVLAPRGAIPPDDPRMEVHSSRQLDNRLIIGVRYHLDDQQQADRAIWERAPAVEIGGRGDASFYRGVQARQEALRQAITNGLRAWLPSRIANRPRRVEGALLLSTPPRLFIDHGRYQVEVRMRVVVHTVTPYQIF